MNFGILRTFILLAILVACSTAFVGCEKDDENNPQGPPSADAYDSEVAQDWMKTSYAAVRDAGYSPPRAARVYGYAGVTMYESVVSGMSHNVSMGGQLNAMPAMPSATPNVEYHWPTVVNYATADVLTGLFAGAPDSVLQRFPAKKAEWDAEFSSVVNAEVMTRSGDYGTSIAAAMLAWSATDGYTEYHVPGATNCSYTVPSPGNGNWIPTPPLFGANPLEPCWGELRPFVLDDVASECSPIPPPAFSEETTSQFYQEMFEVWQVCDTLGAEGMAIATYWADGPTATGTPAGHWVMILAQLAGEDNYTLSKLAEANARIGIAMNDAFISCWYVKYQYNLIRPVSCIRDLIDSTWSSPIGTPAFPEYTSGHSTQSGASAYVLTDFLGEFGFTDHTHDSRGFASRSFNSFDDAAEEAAISRLYGGIHYRAAIEAGLDQGRCIGQRVASLNWRTGS